MVRQDLFFQLLCWKLVPYSCLLLRGIGVNALAPRLDLSICTAALIFAVGLAQLQTPAWAQESRTVVLAPQKHPGGQKFAVTAAKWITIKAEREAAVIVIETDTSSAVQVLSGNVTIRNLADKSVVSVGAGSAYETIVSRAHCRQPQAFFAKAAETIALFESKSNTSYLYRFDVSTKFKAAILTPPLNQTYSIGDVAAARLPMSRMVSTHFPPAGVVVWHPPTPALAEEGKSQ
jgi:hypothetical protein